MVVIQNFPIFLRPKNHHRVAQPEPEPQEEEEEVYIES
jgi:hypothetical protein